ncbi:MAG: DUF362 domain-containing protein [Acidobacteriia bacterium]|nr:DUF362 domain-containing protein [Terriglobia bacterium]
MDRREFVKTLGTCSIAAGGIVLGVPMFGQEKEPPQKVETNILDFTKVPKTRYSLPGPFPGRVIRVTDKRSLQEDRFDAKVIAEMVEKGIARLTGKSTKESFGLFFEQNDIIGLKVNPVGPPLINTRPELVEAVIEWLVTSGVPKQNIIIWDRFDYMLKDAGFTPARFPGVGIQGLQTMDETGNNWRDQDGNHLSINNFDREFYYFAKGVVGKNVQGYKDDEFYLNQHVFNGEYSYFGKLITRKLTKIVNLAAYKNTGNAISMACKNLGYGSICNSGRLHAPLSLNVCAEVLAAPVIRDKLVLNITDGIRGQYEGGPDKNAQFVYANHSLYFATDPFALDMVCHRELVGKRKEMGIQVNENPRFTEYLHYGEKLGLGVANVEKINLVQV